MTVPVVHDARKQSLRLRRFYIALFTYLVGTAIMALCSAVGLLPASRLWTIGAAFALVNLVIWIALRSGYNLRFADPSLTLPQVLTGVTTVAVILSLGEGIHFLAVPFYSAVFVFAMLQLRPRQLLVVEVYLLATYALVFWLRHHLYGSRLDMRIEAIHAGIVVLSSIWYAFAASYISQLRARLRESLHTIEQLALRDAVTETFNRRHIDALLGAELQRLARIGGSLCVCLVDIDRFKSVNDRFGHAAGDAVLLGVARAMTAQLRGIDMLGRYGGEEFLILLPGTPLAAGQVCAERLRTGVAALGLLPEPAERVTVSIGLAEGAAGDTVASLVARADDAMYRAKHAGRNRVEAAATPRKAAADGPPRGAGAIGDTD